MSNVIVTTFDPTTFFHISNIKADPISNLKSQEYLNMRLIGTRICYNGRQEKEKSPTDFYHNGVSQFLAKPFGPLKNLKI